MVETLVSLVYTFTTPNPCSKGSAIAGQNTTYIPHKGVLSPSEKVLYISYSNGGGPYDGTLGSVWRYSQFSPLSSSYRFLIMHFRHYLGSLYVKAFYVTLVTTRLQGLISLPFQGVTYTLDSVVYLSIFKSQEL